MSTVYICILCPLTPHFTRPPHTQHTRTHQSRSLTHTTLTPSLSPAVACLKTAGCTKKHPFYSSTRVTRLTLTLTEKKKITMIDMIDWPQTAKHTHTHTHICTHKNVWHVSRNFFFFFFFFSSLSLCRVCHVHLHPDHQQQTRQNFVLTDLKHFSNRVGMYIT